MASVRPLELKISPFQILFSVLAVLGAVVLILGRFVLSVWSAPHGFDAVSLLVGGMIGGAIAWWIYVGARRMWFETGLYLRADEDGMTVHTRYGRRALRWDEIYDFTTEGKSTSGESGYWLSLRGRDKGVLAQWDRNWCRYTGGQLRRGDEIETYIRKKLRDLGRLQGDEKLATQRWESLHPLSQETTLQVKTNTGWIGWMSIVVFLPASVISWHHPTGGPVVGSGFLAFVVLGVYLVSAKATLLVSEQTVETTSFYGTCRMRWSEVTSVQMDEQGTALCFQGADKRLCFSGPGYWANTNKGGMILFLSATCEKRGIPFDTRSKPKSGLGTSKNTRVRRRSGGM